MAKVVATGGVPGGSRAAQIGAAFGTGLGDSIGANMELNAFAKKVNPMREALLEQLEAMGGPQTPQQILLKTAAQDPRQFAMFMRDPKQLAVVSNMMQGPAPRELVSHDPEKDMRDPVTGEVVVAGKPKVEPRKFIDVVEGGSETAKGLGLNIPTGEFARVEFTVDDAGEPLQPPSVIARFATRADAAGSGDDTDHPFGTGRRGRALEHAMNLASRYATNELNPDEERLFLTAVTELRQPEQFTDPDTGLVQTRRGELPDFVRKAFDARGAPEPGANGAPLPQPQPTPAPDQQPTPDMLAANPATAKLAEMGGADPRQAVQSQVQAVQQFPTLPADAVLPSWLGEETIGESALRGKVTGIGPGIARGLTRIPFLGIDFPEQTSLKQTVPILRNRFVKALQTNPRFAVTERQDIIVDIDLDPALVDTPQAFLDRLVGVDRALEAIEMEMREVVGGRRALVSGETRQHAMDTLQTIQHYRGHWLPPRIETFEESERFSATNPPGTQFIYKDENGSWQFYRVKGDAGG